MLQEGQREEIKIAEALRDVQNVLARSLPRLRFLSVNVGPYFRLDERGEYINLPEQRIWWRVRRHEDDGRDPEVELIPQWKGEQLSNRLHNMDYESLLKIKPHEIDLD